MAAPNALPPVPPPVPDIKRAMLDQKITLIETVNGTERLNHDQTVDLMRREDPQYAYRIDWRTVSPLDIRDRGSTFQVILLQREREHQNHIQQHDAPMVFRNSGNRLFIKRLDRRYTEHPDRIVLENCFTEVGIMQHFAGNGTHLMSCFEALWDDDYLYIVMPLMEHGDLERHVNWSRRFGVGHFRTDGGIVMPGVHTVAMRIVESLSYFASHRLVHRDLKPENILVNAAALLFPLADFAQTLRIDQDAELIKLAHGGLVGGSETHISPERLSNHAFNGKADVWAFGVVLFNMITGHRFDGPSSRSDRLYHFFIRRRGLTNRDIRNRKLRLFRLRHIRNDPLLNCIKAVEDIGGPGRHLLQWLLEEKPGDRPTIDQIRGHRFFG